MSWPGLPRASWRGIEFGVWDIEGSFGRATFTHDYPFRDSVWVEDLGRQARKLGLIGFRLGDDVAALEREMIDAAEEEGTGELVHPTLGSLTVTVTDFRSHIRHDLGRVVEFHFVFIESGERAFPAVLESLGAGITRCADALDLGAAGDFAKTAGDALKRGTEVVRQATSTMNSWMGLARRAIGDVRGIAGAVGAVVPGFGSGLSRFLGGAGNPLTTVTRATSTVTGALSRFTSLQRTATTAVTKISNLLGGL